MVENFAELPLDLLLGNRFFSFNPRLLLRIMAQALEPAFKTDFLVLDFLRNLKKNVKNNLVFLCHRCVTGLVWTGFVDFRY